MCECMTCACVCVIVCEIVQQSFGTDELMLILSH